jgi:glucose/arabinose dehydrogenase
MRMTKFAAACIGIAALAGSLALAPQDPDGPGRKHLIRPQDMPRPFTTRAADNQPVVVPRPGSTLPQVPAGFKVNVFAEGLGGNNSPRKMAVAPNGDVFVTLSGDSRIVVLRDADGDGVAETRSTFATAANGLYLPFGLAFYRDWLYVANTNGVGRFPYRSGQLRASGRGEAVVQGIPGLGYNQHWTRDILFNAEGTKLFLSVGSESNLGEEEERRAAILEYNPDGSGYRRYAFGIRNPVGLAIHPVTRQLYCTCNERDGMGDDLAPDYFTGVREGGFYGWPYSYIGRNLEPRMNGAGMALAQQAIVPDVLFQSHSAALGCVFYTGRQFPEEYRNDVFVAFHGSWNRSLRTGYKVVRVHFRNNRPEGDYEDFLTGFMIDPARREVWGRPVDVAVAKDGALLISDDGGHRIWRVSYSPGR